MASKQTEELVVELVHENASPKNANDALVEACQLALKAIYSSSSYHDGCKLANDAVPALEVALKKAGVI